MPVSDKIADTAFLERNGNTWQMVRREVLREIASTGRAAKCDGQDRSD